MAVTDGSQPSLLCRSKWVINQKARRYGGVNMFDPVTKGSAIITGGSNGEISLGNLCQLKQMLYFNKVLFLNPIGSVALWTIEPFSSRP